MGDLGDHATGLGRIDELGDAADFVELETDQGLVLAEMTARRAAGLPDCDGLASVLIGIHDLLRAQSTAASASTSRRRAAKVETSTLRRGAAERGESWRLSASNVARTTL